MSRTVYEHNCSLVTEDRVLEGSAAKRASYPIIQVTPGRDEGTPAEATGAHQNWSRHLLQLCQQHLQFLGPYAHQWILEQTGISQHAAKASLPPAIAWHPGCQALAASDGGAQVLIFALRDEAGSSAESSPEPCMTLANSHQQQVAALAWRPQNQSILAVGCQQGICLWNLPLASAASRQQNGGGAVMTLLRSEGVHVTSLAWAPHGRVLAAGSIHAPGILIWDISSAACQHLQADLTATALLSWCPSGGYLFTASSASGSFRLWSTDCWDSKPFSAPAAQSHGSGNAGRGLRHSAVTGACWHKHGKMILLSFQESNSLVALHLVGSAPSLECQLLAVPLSGVSDQDSVNSIAWEPNCARLAVSSSAGGGDALVHRQLLLYATDCQPLVSARLLGRIHEPAPAGAAALGTAIQFQPSFPHGALMAVRSCCELIMVVPLLYPQP